jgi:hypothetical protein
VPTIDYRIDTNSPVRHGDATVGAGGGVPPNYARPQPDVIATSGNFETLDTRFRAGPDWDSPTLPLTSADTVLASGAGAVLYYPAPGMGKRHVFYGFDWGYNATPSGGASFGIQSPSGTYVYGPVPVVSAGAGFSVFEQGLRMPMSQDALVELKSGGAGVGGRVSLKGRRVE